MRYFIRHPYLQIALILAAASVCLLPGDPLHSTVKPHKEPLVCGNSTPAQEALAYPSSARAPRSLYELEYQQAWELVGRYFLYRERLGAWPLWKHHFDGQLNNIEDTQSAINAMVSSLKDDYTYCRDVDATTERRQEEDRQDVVSSKMLPGNIGYLHLSMFNSKDCVDEATEALQQLSTARSYIIDLRGNKGGAINNAYHFFSLLTPQGKFVRMDGLPDGKPEVEDLSLTAKCSVTKKGTTLISTYREPNLTGNKPMVVLVDGTTKSAAEMVAGALRDDDRAILIGTRTFGKGIIQRVWEFDDGTSIKITAARYYLPGGENPHGVGLKPNIVVASNKKHDDSQLQAAVLLLSKPARLATTAKKHTLRLHLSQVTRTNRVS